MKNMRYKFKEKLGLNFGKGVRLSLFPLLQKASQSSTITKPREDWPMSPTLSPWLQIPTTRSITVIHPECHPRTRTTALEKSLETSLSTFSISHLEADEDDEIL